MNVTTEDQFTSSWPRSQTDITVPEKKSLPKRSSSLLVQKTVPSTALSRQQSEGQNSRLRHTVLKQSTIEELKAVKEQDNQLHFQQSHKRKSKAKPRQSIEFTKVDHVYFDDEDIPGNQATNQIEQVASEPEDCEEFRPLLVFIPLRLGQETFNMEYSESLRVSFVCPISINLKHTHTHTYMHQAFMYTYVHT